MREREDEHALGRPLSRRLIFALLSAVCVLVIGAYLINAKSGWVESGGSSAANTYYNLLAQGFRSGQLNLRRDVPSGLAQLADPYDPQANRPYLGVQRPLLDLSYYRGRLYLYFGATPAVVLFLPHVFFTGHYLLHRDAVVIFLSLGFLASVVLLWSVWRHYLAGVGFGVFAAGVLALGWANFALPCLQRCDVYEVAISAGCAFTMLASLAVWKALHDPDRRVWWLAGASVAYGVAIGARPSLLFGALILLAPVVEAWSHRPEHRQRNWMATLCLAAVGPIGLIGLGLLLYNYLRFDNPLEFGQNYQLNNSRPGTVQQFGLHFLWFNFRVGFLAAATWSGRFPFVQDISLPSLPRGAAVEQLPFGILTSVPLVWLAPFAPLIWWNRPAAARSRLRWFVAGLAFLFGSSALVILLHNSMCLRYQMEFLSPLVLLAVLGIFGLERAFCRGDCCLANDGTGTRGWFRVLPRAGPLFALATRLTWRVLLAVSVAFNWLAMCQRTFENYVHHGVFAVQKERLDEAAVSFRKALALQPDSAGVRGYLGRVLFRQGKVLEGIAYLEDALRLKPEDAGIHHNLGAFLLQLGRVPEGIGHLEQVIRLKPDSAEGHFNLGIALFQSGQAAEAIRCFEMVLQLDPRHFEARHNLGMALLQVGRVPEGISYLEQATRLKPEEADTSYNLGMALLETGRLREAIGRFEQVLRLNPEHISAARILAWLLATSGDASIRNGQRAVELAERANGLVRGKDAGILDTLAAAYSETGQYAEAVRTARQALELAKKAGTTEATERIEGRLHLYESARPYHEAANPDRGTRDGKRD